MNILVLCYCVSPTRGSEYSVAWNYLTNMSRHHKITVLYGASGDHMGDVSEIEEYLKENSLPNLTFHCVRASRFADFLNYFNKKGIFRYAFYFAFKLWHRSAYKDARELCRKEKFDLVHLLGPIGYREPGFLWKLNLPYMWGPIGGLSQYPPVMFDTLGIKDRLIFSFRNLANSLQLGFSVRVRRALKRANKVLVASTQMQKEAEAAFGMKFDYLPENGIIRTPVQLKDKFATLDDGPIRLIAVGRLDGRKNFIVPMMALCRAKHYKEFHLDIVGEGPLHSLLQSYADTNGLSDNVTFHGAVSRDRVFVLMNESHLNIISSICEGNPTVILEAISCGVPTITVDHCGMHDSVNERTGYRYSVNGSESMADELASIFDHIASNRSEIIEKSKNVLDVDKKFIWGNSRISFIEDCYKDCIADFNRKKTGI